MNSIKIVALALIVAGILGLTYGGFSYTKDTTVVKIGTLEISAKEKETVNIPLWAGIGAIVVGGLLLVMGGFAVIQILVHMVYFLHMNGKIEGGWTLLATIFTVVFVAITIAGTLWVMFHMNANMMPEHPPMPGMGPAGTELRSSP